MFNVRWHEIIYEAKFFGLISFIIQCCMLLELNQYYRRSNWGALGAHSLTKFCVCVCVCGGGGGGGISAPTKSYSGRHIIQVFVINWSTKRHCGLVS